MSYETGVGFLTRRFILLIFFSGKDFLDVLISSRNLGSNVLSFIKITFRGKSLLRHLNLVCMYIFIVLV